MNHVVSIGPWREVDPPRCPQDLRGRPLLHCTSSEQWWGECPHCPPPPLQTQPVVSSCSSRDVDLPSLSFHAQHQFPGGQDCAWRGEVHMVSTLFALLNHSRILHLISIKKKYLAQHSGVSGKQRVVPRKVTILSQLYPGKSRQILLF